MTLLSTLLEISIYSGILFIGIMLLKRIFKTKMSPFLHYIVWGLFIIRLIVPVTLDAPVHMFTCTAQAMPAAPADNELHADIGLVQTPSDISESEPSDSTHDELAAAPVNVTPAFHPAWLTATQTVLAVWMGGALICLIYMSVIACLFKRRIKRHAAPASTYLLRLLDEVKAELGIKTNLKLVCQYDYGSPALLFPRTILIHMDTLAALDDEGIKNCLRHECMHYKHGDHAASLGLTLLSCVYWFNPFVWMACHEIRKDLELLCDTAVVKRMSPSAKHNYAELIVALSAQTGRMQFALGMIRNKKAAMRRIKGVFMAQKTKRSVKLVSAVTALVLAICCFTTACQPLSSEPMALSKMVALAQSHLDGSHTLKDITLPDGRYTYQSKNPSLTINVDAKVVKPHADKMPIARVKPMMFSQKMVTGIFNYLYPDKKPYLLNEQPTKGEITKQISSTQKILSLSAKNSSLLSEEQLTSYNEQMRELEKAYQTAPEEKPALAVSDGTIQRIPAISNGTDGDPADKERCELRAGLDGTHLYIDYFTDEKNPEATLLYTTSSAFSSDSMLPVSENYEMPDAVQNDLEPSYKAAVEKADGFFAAAGLNDVMLFSAYYVKDSSAPVPKYTYKLVYTRTVNGVPVGCHISDSGSGQNGRTPWRYESIDLLISDKGILDLRWESPCAVTEILNDDASLISFDTAVDKFQSSVTHTYGNYVDIYKNEYRMKTSIDISVNSVNLNLVRLRESDVSLSGLYVPAYVFYGTVKQKNISENGNVSEAYMTSIDSGNDFSPPEPFMVMAINAVDGSTIDTMTDIY